MSFSITVTEDKKIWDNLKKNILLDSNKELNVGFFPEAKYGPENDNLQVAQVAQWNNEGHAINNVPPRPFFTTSVLVPIESRKKDKLFKNSIERIIEGKSSFIQEYTFIGKTLVETLQKSIEDWSTPPNSPRTIAEKGFNDPLIKTELMHDSVDFKIEKG